MSSGGLGVATGALVALAFGAAPALLRDYQLIFVAELLCWGLFAMAFDLVYGYAGMLSFCQAIFFGAGAYGVAYAVYFWQSDVWVALGLGLVVALAAAAVIGFVAIRVSGHHFLLITIILSVLVSMVLESGQWRWLTGGYAGRPFPTPAIPIGVTRLSMQSEVVAFYFVSLLGLLAALGSVRVVRSPLGRAVAAIRDNERRARTIGIPVERAKLVIFVLAGALAGLAGGLYSLLYRYTNPTFFDWSLSGKAIVWTVLGGAGTLIGPVIGSSIYIMASEVLSGYFRSFPIVFGALLIVVIIAFPRGLMGLVQARWRR